MSLFPETRQAWRGFKASLADLRAAYAEGREINRRMEMSGVPGMYSPFARFLFRVSWWFERRAAMRANR